MTENKPSATQPTANDRSQQDTIEQLELANQVIEKAQEQLEQAQMVIQGTKEALVQQGGTAASRAE
jgi:hypothetical protein